MAAVLGIVRSHNGVITVESAAGRGTTIEILFPAVAEAPKAEKKDEDDSRDASGWRGEGTVLLVDDEKGVRTIAGLLLERLGFDVIKAEDGDQAVEVFRERHGEICCVILDMTMPRMDGSEAFDAMAEIDPEVPVIISSGYSRPDVAARFEGREPAGFIHKPYRFETMAAALSALLDPSMR